MKTNAPVVPATKLRKVHTCATSASQCSPHPPHVAPLHAAWATTVEGAGQCEINVLLAVNAHQERRHVHDLLANTVERTGKTDGLQHPSELES